MTGSDHLRNTGIDWRITSRFVIGKSKGKVKQSCYRPRGFQEVKVPRLHDDTGLW
jgi:hypothetical protein